MQKRKERIYLTTVTHSHVPEEKLAPLILAKEEKPNNQEKVAKADDHDNERAGVQGKQRQV